MATLMPRLCRAATACARFGPDPVLKAHRTQHVAIHHMEHRGAPARQAAVPAASSWGSSRPPLPDQGRTAHPDRPAAHRGTDAAAG